MRLLQHFHRRRTRQIRQLPDLEARLQSLHDHNDFSFEYQQQIHILTAQVKQRREWEQHRAHLYSRVQYLRAGDAPTAYFHKLHKRREARNRLRILQRDDAQILQDPKDILEHCVGQYQSLYTSPIYTDAEVSSLHTTLQNIPAKFTSTHQLYLQENPSLREITEVVNLLPRNKAPGLDSLTADGLRKQWDYLATPVTGFILYYWDCQVMPSQHLQAVLRLLPKVDDPVVFGHWRPISLLTPHYKLVAKILAVRLATILPLVVPCQQTGFVKGRSTLDNILCLQLIHEYLKSHRQHAVFLKLDFAKAYDKLAQQYLWLLMDKLNCGTRFIRLVKGLHVCASAKILAGGQFSTQISISRGVRQGCPLAPLLFALASIPLVSMLQAAADRGSIKAVRLPSGLHIVSSCYADDTAIFIQLHRQSYIELQLILDTYCRATGSCLNLNKSEFMLIGTRTPTPSWLQHTGAKILQPTQQLRGLGLKSPWVMQRAFWLKLLHQYWTNAQEAQWMRVMSAILTPSGNRAKALSSILLRHRFSLPSRSFTALLLKVWRLHLQHFRMVDYGVMLLPVLDV
ncbi:hypothetical protein R1sor_001217 [Riccia sorocarpa]|uniref:Reverse transcriptase domain-containing protein n=1 Tax=Riccia sorocarpa TaxID=122646 RepID=A0ABD3GYG2_9MARC